MKTIVRSLSVVFALLLTSCGRLLPANVGNWTYVLEDGVNVTNNIGHTFKRIEPQYHLVSYTISPNGRLLVTISKDDAGNVITWLLDWEKGETIAEIPGNPRSVDFSPDSQTMMVTGTIDGKNAMYFVDLSGKVIGRSMPLEHPVWNPVDADLVAGTWNKGDGDYKFGIYSISKKKWVIFLDSEPREYDFAWSPDGSRLAYSQNGEIWRVLADGSEKIQLNSDNQEFGPAKWEYSPDGQLLSYTTINKQGEEIVKYLQVKNGQEFTMGRGIASSWITDTVMAIDRIDGLEVTSTARIPYLWIGSAKSGLKVPAQ